MGALFQVKTGAEKEGGRSERNGGSEQILNGRQTRQDMLVGDWRLAIKLN